MSGDEEKSLVSFRSKALRGPRKDAVSQAMASLVVQTLRSGKPIEKVLGVCDIIYVLLDEDIKELGLDAKFFETIDPVARTLAAPTPCKFDGFENIQLGWSFDLTPENWDRYMVPWGAERVKLTFSGYLLSGKYASSYFVSPAGALTLLSQTGMTQRSYQSLVNRFVTYAMPQSIRTLRICLNNVNASDLEAARRSYDKQFSRDEGRE